MNGSFLVSNLSFGSASADHLSTSTYTAVKEKLSQDISKIIGIPFYDPEDFSLEGKNLTVSKQGEKFERELTSEEAKRVSKVLARSIGFIRNTGEFEYGSACRKEAVLSLFPPPKSIKDSITNFVFGPLDNALSFCADSLAAFSLRAGGGAVAKSMRGLVGLIDLASGIAELQESRAEMAEADKLNDIEGYQKAEANEVKSQLEIAAGSIFITQSVWSFAAPGMSGIAVAFCLPLFMLLMSVESVIGIALPILGIQRCRSFLRQLDEYLENPDLNEEQKIAGALRYLQEIVSITPEEESALTQLIPDASKRDEAIKAIIENKMRHAKRRTSLKSLSLIANTADELLRQISDSDPTTKAGGIEQAKQLIGQVRKASYCKIALYTLAALAIGIVFSAMIAGVILTGGSLPLILALGAGALCLALSLYSWISRDFFRSGETELNLQPASPLIP